MAWKKRKELSMRKIREILRLRLSCKIGVREIARSCSISHSTVGEYLSRVEKAGLTWSRIEKMDNGELVRLVKSNASQKDKRYRPQPNWNYLHKELRKKGVTLQLLWEEYKVIHPEGYQSSQFNEHYNR